MSKEADRAEDEGGKDLPLFGAFVEQLAESDPALRSSACWTLGQLRYGPAVRPLSRLLSKDEDALVRVAAAQALALVGGAAAAQALIRGLKDRDELVLDTCVLGLGSLRDAQGVYPLETMLGRRDKLDEGLVRRIEWAVGVLKAEDDPGTRPDRRRGGVSRKITRYLQKLVSDPKSGIAHNNLAVAYFHAAEFELAVRHCLLAKELGARVNWLWAELVSADHDPSKSSLSDEDRCYLEGELPSSLDPASSGEPRRSYRFEREPRRRSGDPEPSDADQKAEEKPKVYRLASGKAGPAPGQRSRREDDRRRRGRRRRED